MGGDITILTRADRSAIFEVINAAAERYRGVIPEESDTNPYMSRDELDEAFDEMRFLGMKSDRLDGVIGVQEREGVTLIRHLYVRPAAQRKGIGTALLNAGIERADSATVLVGTWKAADWAIEFYEQNGFENLGTDIDLLSQYWSVPDHQMASSVVLRYQAEK